jgi:hypothetical protein
MLSAPRLFWVRDMKFSNRKGTHQSAGKSVANVGTNWFVHCEVYESFTQPWPDKTHASAVMADTTSAADRASQMMMMMISHRVKHGSCKREFQDWKKGRYETESATCSRVQQERQQLHATSPMMTYKMKRKPDVRVQFRRLNSLKPYLWFQPMTLGSMVGGGRDSVRNTNVLKLENRFDE